MSSCGSELGAVSPSKKRRTGDTTDSEDAEDECPGRLTGLAPETVCMLAVWTETTTLLEARATCRTLKRTADEVTPWMVRRGVWWTENGEAALKLAAVDVEVMRRTVLHAVARMGNAHWVAGAAAWMGCTDVVAWLHEKGYEWDRRACAAAVRHGHLEALKYMRRNGCPWGVYVCEFARANRREHILEYAHAGTRETWSCTGSPCRWAREHRTNKQ